jgi:hypothetical protein
MEAPAMKRVLVLWALAGPLILAGAALAEPVHTRLTREKSGDHLYSFTVKVKRVKEGGAEFLQFAVTARLKDPNTPRLPRLAGALEIFDGKALVSSCDVRQGESKGGVTFSFRVAARYAERSRFTFAETLGPEGEGQGFYYWFYLSDFARGGPDPE